MDEHDDPEYDGGTFIKRRVIFYISYLVLTSMIRGLKIDTGKQIGSHKRRSSVDSPYFGDKKKPEPNPPVNYHIASLFGDPQKRKSSEIIQPMRSQQYSQEIGSNDYMFRTILESPMKRFVSRSVQEIQDPQPQQQYEGSYPSHEDQEDGDF